ncbi:MAG TPA: hypothetical protein PK529_05915 [Verrucomicrobiales bacterium]|nr:hypothetical protein [Verrucomicrobiales bacterium]
MKTILTRIRNSLRVKVRNGVAALLRDRGPVLMLESGDMRAAEAEAVALFCDQAKKSIRSFSAVPGDQIGWSSGRRDPHR